MKVLNLGNPTTDLSSPQFKEFYTKIFGKKPFVLFVYAEWCGHCRMAKPVIDEISHDKSMSDILLVKVSDEVHSHLVSRHPDISLSQLLSHSVSGFPTIAIVSSINKKQKPDNEIRVDHFQGERTKQNLKKFFKLAKIQ
jgi:thiol-disulfide isomerase/thioredoxin